MSLFLQFGFTKDILCVPSEQNNTISELKNNIYFSRGVPKSLYYITKNGHICQETDTLHENAVYHCVPRLLGGKGGFGSMLRAIGAQIEKTTNREACRDISGRRMRDVNNEKQMKEWLSKQADKERERERMRQERTARRRAMPMHKFEDTTYHDQKESVSKNLDDAISAGLQKTVSKGSSGDRPTNKGKGPAVKRKHASKPESASVSMKAAKWLDKDFENLSDMESDESDTDTGTHADPGPDPLLHTGNNINDTFTDSRADDAVCNSVSGGADINSSLTGDGDKCVFNCELNSNKVLDDGGRRNPSMSEGSNLPITSAESSSRSSDNSDLEDMKSKHCDKYADDAVLFKIPAPKKVSLLSQLSEHPPKCDDVTGTTCGRTSMPPAVVNMKPEDVNLDDYGSASELEKLGLDLVKAVLMMRGLKCGGTLQQRAERLFSVKGVELHQIDKSLLAKPRTNGKKSSK